MLLHGCKNATKTASAPSAPLAPPTRTHLAATMLRRDLVPLLLFLPTRTRVRRSRHDLLGLDLARRGLLPRWEGRWRRALVRGIEAVPSRGLGRRVEVVLEIRERGEHRWGCGARWEKVVTRLGAMVAGRRGGEAAWRWGGSWGVLLDCPADVYSRGVWRDSKKKLKLALGGRRSSL